MLLITVLARHRQRIENFRYFYKYEVRDWINIKQISIRCYIQRIDIGLMSSSRVSEILILYGTDNRELQDTTHIGLVPQ